MGEWFTRASIWIAMAAWTWGIVEGRRSSTSVFRSRAPWLFGLIFYAIHIVLAYEIFYEWSHTVAWEKTALDTAAATGVKTGVGLLLNFLFGAWLIWDFSKRWNDRIGGTRYVTEGLVFFFILNGAIVFGDGPVVALGVILCLAIAAKWILERRQRSHPPRAT
ncbi:MAG: hypothetical protein P1U85_01775 [Verrucomicrobiales bacterium]|nr:hypothetical protein [Verrucomicrobiales bacterium]